jgi:hypothetical protein
MSFPPDFLIYKGFHLSETKHMKRRLTLSIALGVVLLSLTSFDSSSAQTQNQIRYVFDTGVITLGPNQFLRISGDGVDQDDVVRLRSREINYTPGVCGGGVCRQEIESQTTSGLIILQPGEAVSIDFRRCTFPICGGVRSVVLSDNKNVQVNVMIIDGATGAVVSAYVLKDILISS